MLTEGERDEREKILFQVSSCLQTSSSVPVSVGSVDISVHRTVVVSESVNPEYNIIDHEIINN